MNKLLQILHATKAYIKELNNYGVLISDVIDSKHMLEIYTKENRPNLIKCKKDDIKDYKKYTNDMESNLSKYREIIKNNLNSVSSFSKKLLNKTILSNLNLDN